MGRIPPEREVRVLYFELVDFIYGHFWVFEVLLLAIVGLSLLGNWLIFKKMGEPGWKGIIPFYSLYVLFEKLYGNGLYACVYLACFIPLAGSLAVFAVNVYTQYRLAQSFHKDIGFTVGLALCGPVFKILLGLDGSRFHKLPPLTF